MKNPPHYPAGDRHGRLRRRRRVAVRGRAVERRGPRRRSTPSSSTTTRSPAVDRPRGRAQRPGARPRGARHQHGLHLGADDRRRGASTRRFAVGRVHGQGALRPAAPHPDGHGAAGRAPRCRSPSAATSRCTRRRRSPTSSRSWWRSRSASPSTSCGWWRPSVGGGFGSKLERLRRGAAVHWRSPASTGVPVRWVEERTENAQATIQGRGQIQDIELAADADGKLTARPGEPRRRHGRATCSWSRRASRCSAPSSTPASTTCPQAYSFSCTGVFTTMTPTDAYRGAGRPEATYAIERAMDAPGRRSSASTRSSCAGATSSRPSSSPTPPSPACVYDSGDHDGALDEGARSWSDYDALPRPSRQRRALAGGTKHLGIGISSYFEMCGLAPSRVLASLNYSAGGWEAATVRVLPTNKVQVVTGATPHGQGHETSWSMIVADRLGVDPTDVDVLHSDTAISPLGLDTYGSRSLAVGGVAIAMALDKVIDKARTIAAHQMEAAEEDLEFAGGHVQRCGARPTRRCRWPRWPSRRSPPTTSPTAMEPNLEAQRHLRPAQLLLAVRHAHLRGRGRRGDRRRRRAASTSPSTTAATQINPLIVEGQVHGGVIQGLAQALFEEAVYDDDGNLTHVHAGRLPGARRRPTCPSHHHSGAPSRRARPTRSASRASARPAPSAPPRPSSTPSSTRSSHLGVTDIAMPARREGLGRHPSARKPPAQTSGGAE